MGTGHLHALTRWDLVGRIPFGLALTALHVASLRRGWAWRPALLATGAFIAGCSLGALLLPSVVGALAGGGEERAGLRRRGGRPGAREEETRGRTLTLVHPED